ncbi:MAG: relaxase/mobilization nuclease domain-containing protein, partial [Angelakisella sp.]
MPLFKGEGYKCTPNKAIEYITRPGKALLVSSLYLDDGENYAKQFRQTATSFGQSKRFDERKYYHFKLSCNPLDKVTPEQSQLYAEQLAQELFSNHECVIATHIDTGIVHTHIIVNAVNFETGRKLHINNKEYAAMKDRANILGEAHGFRKLDWRKESPERVKQAERHIKKEGRKSWKEELCSTLDKGLAECDSFISLRNYLEKRGVVLKDVTDKTISFVYKDKVKAVRGKSLGTAYTREAIEQQLKQNRAQARNLNLEHVDHAVPEHVDHAVPEHDNRSIVERLRMAQPPDSPEDEKHALRGEKNASRGAKAADVGNVGQHEHGEHPADAPQSQQAGEPRCSMAQRVVDKLHRTTGNAPELSEWERRRQSKYDLKVMAGNLNFMAEHGVCSYGELERKVSSLLGSCVSSEQELHDLEARISRIQHLRGAALNCQANRAIAEQYMNKVLFRDNFYRKYEKQLKAYAKGAAELKAAGLSESISPQQLLDELEGLRQRHILVVGQLRLQQGDLERWQR